MIINAKDFGVVPNRESAQALEKMLISLQNNDDEKTVVFEKGDYLIDSSKLKSRMLYITNTVGDKEFSSKETPHKSRCPLCFEGIKNAVIDFGGARFVIDGKATNICLINCENVVLKNGEITAKEPDLHRIKVVSKTAFSVDFEVTGNYYIKNHSLWFKGKDYDYNAVKKYRIAWHTAHIKAYDENTVKRNGRVFAGAVFAKEIRKGVVRVYYFNTAMFIVGDMYYLFDNRREFVGIFLDNSKNITLENMAQRFNYSLAVVAQCCENLTIKNCDFSPEKGVHIASLADFIQICMCSGDVLIENNYFEGACDDCLNAHGIHFKIKKINGSKMTVSFMHPQTHGFNPLFAGDKIIYTDPASLIEKGSAEIVSSKLIDEYNIELEVTNTNGAKVGFAVEDLTRIPNVTFRNNTLNRIITRGILLTLRGRAVVENNHFMSNSMSGILLSDDAKSWYESGACRDVLIKNNVFDYCGEVPILIKPENRINGGCVHKNVRIIGNTFKKYSGEVMNIKCSENIEITDNIFEQSSEIKQTDCRSVVIK